MEESKRWIVTYTKHIRQKRKVYQDGILELHCPSNKVLLYDDSLKLLDSRFLKKDDLVECGATLTFETHLVDVSELDETHKPPKDPKMSNSNAKSNEKAQICGLNSRNSVLAKKKSQTEWHGSTNTYPHDIQVTERDKRLELQTSNKVQNQRNSKPAIAREWDVLYTTQITQKAKRYHDGILKLVSCGLHTNQLILFKEDGTILSSKFQKSAECLSMGNTFEMPNYLVEICNQRSMQEDVADRGRGSHNCIRNVGLRNATRGNMKVEKNSGSCCPIQKDSLPNTERGNVKENPKNYPPDKEVVIRSSGVSRFTEGEEVLVNKPIHRDAFQILSSLRRPPQESLLTKNLLVDQAHPRSLNLLHSDLQGSGGVLKSVSSPVTPSDITKVAAPNCEVELLALNCSASSVLHGEEARKTSVTNLSVKSSESMVKDFPDLGAFSMVSEASDAANGLSGRSCMEESLLSNAEEKPKLGCTDLHNSRTQSEKHGNNEICSQLPSDDVNSEKEEFEEARASCVKDKASELKTSRGETTAAECPSFDLGIEL